MKNKKAEISLNVIIMSALALLVIVILAIIFTGRAELFRESFNPDEDVCLEEELTCKEGYYMKGNICFKWFKRYDAYFPQHTTKCSDWRPKTICKLNPNDERCICDEWKGCKNKEILYDWLVGDNITFCYDDGGYRTYPTEEEEKYEKAFFGCIKSHLPNECELNNPDWVWDYKVIGIKKNGSVNKSIEIDNQTLNITIDWKVLNSDEEVNFGDVKIKKECGIPIFNNFCRKKTIYDYSCKDYKRAIDLNLVYCPHNNEFTDSSHCPFTRINKIQIYDIAIEKGCEI